MPGSSHLLPSVRHHREHLDICPVDDDGIAVKDLADAIAFSVFVVRPIDNAIKRADIEASVENHLQALKALLEGIQSPIDHIQQDYFQLRAYQEALQFTPIQVHYNSLLTTTPPVAATPPPIPKPRHLGKPVVSGVPTLPVRQISSPGPSLRAHSPNPSTGQPSLGDSHGNTLGSSPRLYRHP